MTVTAPAHQPHASPRTCVGCGARASIDDLVRFVLSAPPARSPQRQGDKPPAVDALAQLSIVLPSSLARQPRPAGRGFHVHPQRSCLEAAARRGIARSLRREVRLDARSLQRAVAQKAHSLALDLLARGARQGLVTAADDAALNVSRGDASLVVIAADTPRSDAGSRPVVGVNAVSLGTQELLGSLVNKPRAGTVVLRHPRLGSAVARASVMANAVGVGSLEDG